MQAVQATEGPVLLLAVPGSGKTTVLVSRLGYMIYCLGITPESILTVTYTVAATNDMRRRFAGMFGEADAERLEFRTINGISQKVLQYFAYRTGKTPFQVADKEASAAVKQSFLEVTGKYATENDIKETQLDITYAKNMRLTPEKIRDMDTDVEKFPEIFRTYNAKLRQMQMIDYDDQMIYALRILEQYPEVLAHFREQYRYFCVDEAQDTSKIQHDMIDLLAAQSRNLFMVGDVKQSIYRFRLARPELFMDKYASFSTEESLQQRIDLHMNFRSRAQVLDFCNDIFYKIMSPDLGRVAYDRDAALYYGAKNYDENAKGFKPELLLLDEKDELLSETKNLTKGQMEAHMIATRIADMKQHMQVTDKESGQLRPLRYSDIVILLRSLKDYGTDFVQVLQGAGIPAYVESSTGYFSASEVQTVLAMLRILDNPYQDIPMAAVLRSPLVGLDEEEMAQIRVENPECSFAEAAMHAMQDATEGALYDFYRMYRKLREKQDLPIHELIQKILQLSGYGNYAAALPAGERRAANLAMLVEKAVDYEKTSYRGLFHFLRYIDKLQKYEVDFGEADTTGENANVVRVMTIHKSKGLEFPVVFVSGLGRKMNQMDASDRLVVHPDLGLGICEISGQPRVKKNSVFRSEIADRIRRENLGEELRILYVALTRAKEKLVLTGMIKDAQKTFSGYTGNVLWGKPVSYRQRVRAGSYLDWILPAMLSYPQKYTLDVVPPEKIVWEEVEQAADSRENYEELLQHIDHAKPELLQQYDQWFSYRYPYQSETGKKSKYSVSELKHASLVLQYDRSEGEAVVPDFLQEDRKVYVPDFAREEDREYPAAENVNQGAMRGTAVHRVMECLDFAAIADIDTSDAGAVSAFVKQELDRMLANGQLPGEWYALVIPEMIEAFVESPIAPRMAAAAVRGDLYRERPFVMQHQMEASGGTVLVQGIIDVFWMENDKIILLDYKTDRVKQAQELLMRYQTQLQLYADALSRVFSTDTKKMVAEEKLIYSFHLKEVVTL